MKSYVNINPVEIAGGSPLNELKITVDYDKGGYNYWHGGVNRRGIYVYFTPVRRGGYCESCVITGNRNTSGFKIFLKELGRRSAKQEEIYFKKLEPYFEKIGELWNENNHSGIYNLVMEKTR